MDLINKKYEKLLDSVNQSLGEIVRGNKRAAIGSLDYIKENAQEIIYILLAEIEQEKEDI